MPNFVINPKNPKKRFGIAAARMHKAVTPKARFCFEANPVAFSYAENMFQVNGL